ncbi:trypsin-like peptidase domain-containing protein [Streptomyces ferrugineus]|uniref:Trypsin-like peptidase domain-containing protein n=1 Tax=Streptomyces ferrugineus TaxID=1413221 RepID=A0A7M2SK15_9ACTN|nr:trypsin-like peptidase domain-containing protein [Streptomyces ferrugineus]QOV35803.1 trypsin-like peptidase domain-containing protein [Streptomyces ferrugineus]
MDEAKPAKAKWWNRPRLQGPSGRTEGAEQTPGAAPAPGGDFELARPTGSGAAGDGPASADGDFELRPAASGDGRDVAPEGDFELERPTGVSAPAPSAADVETAADDAGAVGAVTAESADRTASAPAALVEDHPKPLHDPDPYSTPPYGEPGPWAPAPPVQHPATTPAQGTAVPMPPPPAQPAPAHPAPMPSAAAPAAPAVGVSAPVPAQATAAPAPAPNPTAPDAPVPTPPPGVPTQETPPAPAPVPTTAPAPVVTIPAQPTPLPSTPTDPPPPANPWQNYDPWARPAAHPTAPLQQNGAAVATEGQRRKRARKVLLVGALLLALVSGGVGGVVGAHLERTGGVGDVELPQTGAAESVGRAPDSVAGIAARALPSVVTLHVSGSAEQGTGTGFVLDDRGHILTNNHVVEPAGDDGEISVTFHSGDTAKATVVGRDGGYDLAVVKVSDVTGLTPLPLGNSDNVRVGDPVVAIGAPFDLAGTVTSGIISAKERPITAGGESGDASDVSYVDALQTDAPINPGNSGGPLLDAQGHVVGINSAIRSADSGSELDGGQAGSIGLGFAIPVNQAKRVAEELINTGRATHPVIGVTLDMDYTGDGARVGTKGSDGGPAVTRGGPGDRAGIEPGDVITQVDGQRVHSGEELIVKTRAHRPGDRLELTLERGGEETTISLTLGSSSGD